MYKMQGTKLAVANKACAERDRRRAHAKHRQAVKNAKPQTDTCPPPCLLLNHIRDNAKREQLLEDQYTEIDRCNRILLQKMSDIMRQPTIQQKAHLKNGPTSLNKDYRKRELIRVTHENQNILKRIQKTQPMYSRASWDRHAKDQDVYYLNSCEYANCLPTHSVSGFGPEASRKLDSETRRAVQARVDKQEIADAKALVDRENAAQKAHESDVRFVLKEGKKICESYYLVEMSTEGRTLTIDAHDSATQKTMQLVVNEKNHRRLYRECDGDYTKLAERLTIKAKGLEIMPSAQAAAKTNELTAEQMAQKVAEEDAQAAEQ